MLQYGVPIKPVMVIKMRDKSCIELWDEVKYSGLKIIHILPITGRGSIPAGAEDFSSSPCVQTVSGAHPASYPMGTWGPFPRGKARPGRDADHSPPSSAEVKYE
jgi:hypothetical protein